MKLIKITKKTDSSSYDKVARYLDEFGDHMNMALIALRNGVNEIKASKDIDAKAAKDLTYQQVSIKSDLNVAAKYYDILEKEIEKRKP